jgi:hypothetical protein
MPLPAGGVLAVRHQDTRSGAKEDAQEKKATTPVPPTQVGGPLGNNTKLASKEEEKNPTSQSGDVSTPPTDQATKTVKHPVTPVPRLYNALVE